MVNLSSREFWIFDENQMILENLYWGNGKGDSVGRNAFAYICWPNESWLKATLMSCIKQRDDSFVQFYRYPGEGADTMSRDHVGAIILALYINRDWKELQFILDNLPWRLSRKYSQTMDFWIWTKCLKYPFWKYYLSQIFYLLILIQFTFILPWNFLIRWILNVKKFDNLNLPVHTPLNGWKKRLSKAIYPHYALFLLAWQIRVCSNSWLKSLTKFIIRFESGNIVIDHLLGKKISRIDWLNFKSCTSFIWSRRLDSLDDVFIERMDMKYNDLNRAMLDYLYFEIDRIMELDDSIIQSIKSKKPIINY